MKQAGQPSQSVSALAAAFPHNRAALICYLMAGYPDRATSLASLHAAARAGADIIELGVPYGDPLADGPVIADAGAQARTAGGNFGLAAALELAGAFSCDLRMGDSVGSSCGKAPRQAPPLVVMTYLNPLLRLGLARSAELMRASHVAGVIVPDMPPEAAGQWRAVAAGLDTVFLAAPTSTDERLALIGAESAGFVYCVSSTGVTGERAALASGLASQVARIKAHTVLPVAVGFGVGTPEQARAVAGIADGVIVGSAIVKRQPDPEEVEFFVRSLAEAIHGDAPQMG